MELEKQVCGMFYAKKLAELGILQESLYYWKENEIQRVVSEKQMKDWIQKYLPKCNNYYSAFTAAELVQMNENFHGIEFSEAHNRFYIGYAVDNDVIYYNSLADALAAKLINSIENQYQTIKQVNTSLQK